MCMWPAFGEKSGWFWLTKCRIFPFAFYKTKLAPAKHENGASAGTSKQP